MSLRAAKQRGNLLLEFPKDLQEIATSQSCAPLLAMTAVIVGNFCLSNNLTNWNLSFFYY